MRRVGVLSLSLVTLLSSGLAGGAAVAAPVTDGELFFDKGANVAPPAVKGAPEQVRTGAEAARLSAPGRDTLNRSARGKAPDRSKRWKYAASGAVRAQSTDRVQAQAISTVDANVAAPGLGVQGHYGLQDFPVADGIAASVNLGNGNLVVRAEVVAGNGLLTDEGVGRCEL